jgi:hypothetical protein
MSTDVTVIRRAYDPDVSQANIQAAINYLKANTKANLDGLFYGIKAARSKERAPTANVVIDFAMATVQTPANQMDGLRTILTALYRSQDPQGPTPELIALAVRAVNYAESETITRAALKQDVADIKIGTEFSFGDGKPHTDPKASINIRTEPDEAPRNESSDKKRERLEKFDAPRDQAKLIIAKWAKATSDAAADIPGAPTIVVTDKKGKADLPR